MLNIETALNVMRVSHCISIRKVEIQTYFALDWTTIGGRIQVLPLCLIYIWSQLLTIFIDFCLFLHGAHHTSPKK